jgi:hypothetical protein
MLLRYFLNDSKMVQPPLLSWVLLLSTHSTGVVLPGCW